MCTHVYHQKEREKGRHKSFKINRHTRVVPIFRHERERDRESESVAPTVRERRLRSRGEFASPRERETEKESVSECIIMRRVHIYTRGQCCFARGDPRDLARICRQIFQYSWRHRPRALASSFSAEQRERERERGREGNQGRPGTRFCFLCVYLSVSSAQHCTEWIIPSEFRNYCVKKNTTPAGFILFFFVLFGPGLFCRTCAHATGIRSIFDCRLPCSGQSSVVNWFLQ